MTIPLPARPSDSATKATWVSYLAAHGKTVEEARSMTKPEMLAWKPPKAPSSDSATFPTPPDNLVQEVDGGLVNGVPETHIAVDGSTHQGGAHPCSSCDLMDTEVVYSGPDVIGPGAFEIVMDEKDWNDALKNCPRWSVQWAILNVMKDVGAVGKNQRNDAPGAKYDFRGVDAVVNACAPMFLKYGVTITPKRRKVINRRADKDTNDGKVLLWSEVDMDYVLEAADGTQRVWESTGAAMDTGDKAIGKAMSVAYRIALLQGLCIPTSQPDPDSFTYGHEDDPDGYQTHGRGESVQQERTGGQQRPDYTDPASAPQPSPEREAANKIRAYTLGVMDEYGMGRERIAEKYRELYKVDYTEELDMERLKNFGRQLRDDAIQDRAMEEETATRAVMEGLGGTVIDAEVVPDAGE